MKKYPRIVQCDARGQIVIPKDMRQELGIDEGSGFWMYSISEEGILLKLVNKPKLEDTKALETLRNKASKLKINPKNLDKTIKKYKKSSKLEEI